jgi:adenylate cyclase
MSEINELVLRFVNTFLSTKSQEYIQKDLFTSDYHTNRILSETPKLQFGNDKDLIIGQLDTPETQLFIIKQTLSKRIAGTRKRMDEVHRVSILSSKREIDEAQKKYWEREVRLTQLISDYRWVYHHLSSIIGDRLKNIIQSTLEKNPAIMKKMYNGFDSGFDFKIVDRNKIVLTNTSVIGGD